MSKKTDAPPPSGAMLLVLAWIAVFVAALLSYLHGLEKGQWRACRQVYGPHARVVLGTCSRSDCEVIRE